MFNNNKVHVVTSSEMNLPKRCNSCKRLVELQIDLLSENAVSQNILAKVPLVINWIRHLGPNSLHRNWSGLSHHYFAGLSLKKFNLNHCIDTCRQGSHVWRVRFHAPTCYRLACADTSSLACRGSRVWYGRRAASAAALLNTCYPWPWWRHG